MRVFLTGATGFIGGRIAQQLRERGDEVRVLARDPAKGGALAARGCEVIAGSLADEAAIATGLEGCDAAIHAAAIYKVGIPESARPEMHEANVRGAERVLEAALAAGTPKVIHVSTVAAFGNTHGEVVDESYEHPGTSFTSYYEETKWQAHRIARRLIAERGLPCTIVQPGGVYGPGDHSELAHLTREVLAGRMPLVPFPGFGTVIAHVDDVAAGILLALDEGATGESYVIGGAVTDNLELTRTIARLAGKRPPRGGLPTPLIKAAVPFGRLVGPLLGFPPNLRELIDSADGVTFWASTEKAKRELGYAPRDLETTIADTLRATGKLAA